MGFYILGGKVMIIEKILNNNVAVTRNESGDEIIVMGKGIAFQKKVGDELPEETVDKTFTLSNQDTSNKFQELLLEIPTEYIAVSEEVITFAKTHLGKKLNDIIHISLCDHIYTAILRSNEGVHVKNALLWDIKRFYKDEYAIGKHALKLIKERFNIELEDDEAGFIALHITNAELDESVEDMYEITKIMQEITNIVKYTFNIEFDEDSVYFYRFITHLKFFAQRMITHSTYEAGDAEDLLDVIKLKYHNAFACVEKISAYIVDKYDYILSQEEKLYLTIHIERIVYKTKKD